MFTGCGCGWVLLCLVLLICYLWLLSCDLDVCGLLILDLLACLRLGGWCT